MPYFDQVIEIEVDEILSSCNSSEKKELLKCLVEDGWIDEKFLNKKTSYLPEEEWNTICEIVKESRLRMSTEDEETIRRIAKKY